MLTVCTTGGEEEGHWPRSTNQSRTGQGRRREEGRGSSRCGSRCRCGRQEEEASSPLVGASEAARGAETSTAGGCTFPGGGEGEVRGGGACGRGRDEAQG